MADIYINAVILKNNNNNCMLLNLLNKKFSRFISLRSKVHN